jgi:hypothetical protein
MTPKQIIKAYERRQTIQIGKFDVYFDVPKHCYPSVTVQNIHLEWWRDCMPHIFTSERMAVIDQLKSMGVYKN